MRKTIPLVEMKKNAVSELLGIDIAYLHENHPAEMNKPHQVQFCVIIFVLAGEMRYQLDFEKQSAFEGTVLQVKPHQVIAFDYSTDWQAVAVCFKPESFLPTLRLELDENLFFNLAQLSHQWALSEQEQLQISRQIELLRFAMSLDQEPAYQRNLLLHQLYCLLTMLIISGKANGTQEDSKRLRRYHQFRHLLEGQFMFHHDSNYYARQLHCTPRSLTRACLEIAGRPAKKLISDRIILEAKRLLVYTDLNISQIGLQLGFEENSHFSQFFKRESGQHPNQYRQINKN